MLSRREFDEPHAHLRLRCAFTRTPCQRGAPGTGVADLSGDDKTTIGPSGHIRVRIRVPAGQISPPPDQLQLVHIMPA